MTCEVRYRLQPEQNWTPMTWRLIRDEHESVIEAVLPDDGGIVTITRFKDRDPYGPSGLLVRYVHHGRASPPLTATLLGDIPMWPLIDRGAVALDPAAWGYDSGVWFNYGVTFSPPEPGLASPH